jgi:hypothetical protein
MKKLFLTLLASCSLIAANAQSHSWLLYGNTTVLADNSYARTEWTLSPGIGYQFNDNWTVGVNLSFTQNQMLFGHDYGHDTVTNYYHFGPFVRYTHTISNLFYCYAQFDANYTGQYRTPGDHPSDMKATGFGAGITPALGINLTHGYGLNLALGGLSYTSVTPDGGSAVSTLNFSFGKVLMVGISKNFGGMHHKGNHEPGSDLRGVKASKEDE